MNKKNLAVATLVLLTIIGCEKKENTTDNSTSQLHLADNYTLNTTGLYPEGIDYDTKNNRFVVGSFYNGKIYTASIKDGSLTTFINNPQFTAITGVFTDEDRNRLIVLSGDAGASLNSGAGGSTAGSKALVGVYELSTGTLIKQIDLKPLNPSGGDFPNDLTIDNSGNIYITNSFSPIVYKIDVNYTASIFANNSLFQPATGTFGLNGIVFHPSGYLIVAKTNDSKLFKIPLNNPTTVTEITGVNIPTPDGLEWSKTTNQLIVIENGLGDGKAHKISSTDNWQTASKISEILIGKNEFPTTCTLAPNGNIYILHSWLGKLLSGDRSQANYSIKAANL